MAPPEEPANPPAAQAVRHKARPREYRDGEHFGTYINHFNRVAAANGWSGPTKLVQLETVLKGKAQREFEMFIEETPEITWDQMITKLKAELIPSIQKSLDEFAQLRMDDKSPKELYASLVRLSKLAHGEMDEEARHIIVRAQMLQALPKKLRHDAGKQEYLSGLDKESLLTLLTRIYDAEMKEDCETASYEPLINKVQHTVFKSTDARISELENENAKLKNDIGEVKDMLKELLKQKPNYSNYQGRAFNQRQPNSNNSRPSYQGRNFGQRQSTSMDASNTQCFRYQKYGHYARDCDGPRVCSYCKKEGHSYADCLQKTKN